MEAPLRYLSVVRETLPGLEAYLKSLMMHTEYANSFFKRAISFKQLEPSSEQKPAFEEHLKKFPEYVGRWYPLSAGELQRAMENYVDSNSDKNGGKGTFCPDLAQWLRTRNLSIVPKLENEAEDRFGKGDERAFQK